jgi:isocitrate dehydrogenase (NAD+)
MRGSMTAQQTVEIAEFLGDGISAELAAAVHRVAEALPVAARFAPVDLTLERRRKDAKGAYQEAEAAIRAHGVALKYPTVTEAESPNKILRERLDFTVIHRPVATIPGVPTRFAGRVDVHVVRVAVGGTYEDAGRRVGKDAAVSVRVIERRPSMQAAMFAFDLARKLGCGVVSTSKWTIQKATDGLFEEAVRDVAQRFPGVPHKAELFDALLAKIIMRPEDFRVIVTPNEYGDFLSDAACGLVGSIGLGASASYSFDDAGRVTLAMFDPAGGTAPDIAGQDACNPSAALWAFAMLLDHAGHRALGRALDQGVRDAIGAGHATRDLGGKLGTAAFTEAAIAATRARLTVKVPAR